MDKQVFEELRRIVYRTSGISLGSTKEALLAARLAQRMRVLHIDDFGAYLLRVQKEGPGGEIVQLLDAISTNITSFFREPGHFAVLRRMAPRWIREGRRRLRFWSAACSSGEEAYSLAMTLSEAIGGEEVDLKILATDISTRALAAAQEGVYDRPALAPVPPALRNRYFERRHEAGEPRYQVRPALRRLIVFKRFNLADPPFPLRGPFDAILCRNVMFYFDDRVKSRLLEEFRRLLRPGGWLFLGHAESLSGLAAGFRCVRPSVLVKTPVAQEAPA
jgi:chemotaxis protein methyltransferase CheR